MDRKSVTLDEFIASYPLWGKWEVSYTDGTHLPKNEYVKLGKIEIDGSEEIARDYPILPFVFRPVKGHKIKSRYSELPEGEKQAGEAKRIIQNELADSLVRTGLLRPKFCLMEEQIVEMRFLEALGQLSKHGYLVLIADTSALRRAVISFLHKTLSKVLIWTVVPVFVMKEVQRQTKELSDLWRKISTGTQPHPGKCKVLSQRPQVSCISRELNHIRRWRPLEMLTTLPEHLDQSNGNSGIDRLIIESAKNIRRDRGLHRSVYLVTGDKDMASLATLENQASLHIGAPRLDLENPPEISSVRYNSHKEELVLTPVHYLLWDLAQVFSTIRFKNKELCRTYELAYYSQEANQGFFAYDVMEIREV